MINECNILKIKTTSIAVSGTVLNITIPTVTLTNGQVFRLCLAQSLPTDSGVTQVYLINGSDKIPVYQPSSLSGNYARADQLKCSRSILMVYGTDPIHASILCRVPRTCYYLTTTTEVAKEK